MMKSLLIAFALALGLAGCAVAPRVTQEQLASADYGSEPTVDQAEAIIKSYLMATLLDPDSAKYRGPSKVQKYWATEGEYGTKVYYGYIAFYAVNAKNAYGGYTGEQRNAVMIRNGKIIGYFHDKGTHWFPDPDEHIIRN